MTRFQWSAVGANVALLLVAPGLVTFGCLLVAVVAVTLQEAIRLEEQDP
jgi:hypothetical protein